MRKILFTALAAAALLSGGMLGNRAGAMTLTAPSTLGVAAAEAGLIQKAVVVCGYRGCVRVYRPYGYYGYYGPRYGYYGPRYYGYYGRPYGYYRW